MIKRHFTEALLEDFIEDEQPIQQGSGRKLSKEAEEFLAIEGHEKYRAQIEVFESAYKVQDSLLKSEEVIKDFTDELKHSSFPSHEVDKDRGDIDFYGNTEDAEVDDVDITELYYAEDEDTSYLDNYGKRYVKIELRATCYGTVPLTGNYHTYWDEWNGGGDDWDEDECEVTGWAEGSGYVNSAGELEFGDYPEIVDVDY